MLNFQGVKFSRDSLWPSVIFGGFFCSVGTLPETNSSPLKMDGWNTTFLLGPGLFSGAMSC